MRSIPARLWMWVVVSALLQLLPFPIAGPVPYWRRFFCWFCLTPLLGVLLDERVTAKQAAWLGYGCGLLWYLGNCYWIYPTMHLYGGLASPVAAGILVLFALYLGLYHALFAWIVAWVRGRWSRGIALAAAPFAWVAVELARGRITGFPWDLLGYTQVDNYGFAVLTTWTGVMGLSLLIAAVNAVWLMPAVLWSRRNVLNGAGLLAVIAVLCGIGYVSLRVSDGWGAYEFYMGASAVLLQENLSVGAEGGPAESRDEMLASFSTLSTRPVVPKFMRDAISRKLIDPSRPDIVLWPEAPADFYDGDPLFREALAKVALRANAPVIADSVTVNRNVPEGERPKIYNSASFFAADGSYQGRYDKMHLVPFGEYTPYKQLFFFAGHLLDNVGTFTPGAARTLFRAEDRRYGVFICYESIFGDEIRHLAGSGAEVLVNLSDDGWYGDSSAPWEHLDMVRMRAIENDRWVLRSTNTGITAAINPHGVVKFELPRHVRASLYARFGLESRTTFYTRHGDWLAWICALIAVGMVGAGFARRQTIH